MVLLIGNFLSRHGLNPTAIEDLTVALSIRYRITTSSNKKNPLFRLLDMAMSVISHRKSCKLIIVDVFSTYALLFSYVVILLAKLFKIPYAPVLRGGYLPERFRKHPNIFNFLFSNASTIICPSKFLQECFDDKKFSIQIIPNYIDLQKYSFKERKKIKPNLLWVRSIHKIYNPQMAIHVLDKIQNIYPDAHLCIVGPVKDNKIMEQLNLLINRLCLRDHVTFSGPLSKKKWIELSINYDIFINTTNFDNHPVSLLEAMALGLPIVSTSVGGILHLLNHDHTAKLVSQNDVSDMVAKIKEYLSDDNERLQITKNARRAVENKYRKEIIIKQWHDIIDEIIEYGYPFN